MNSPAPRLPPADELTDFMERIYRYRMTTTSGGNLSIRDGQGRMWITPAHTDKGNLGRADIVCVHSDGCVEGRHKPSSEHPFHQLIYAARPDLRAIVHAHPVALVAFSICGRKPDTRIFPRTHAVCGPVGFAPYALPGSRRLGENIAAEFARGVDCVMLENHGVVVGGESLTQAFERFETLEFTARIELKARMLGGEIRPLSPAQLVLAERRDKALPEFAHALTSAPERELREELARFIRRGYKQRLLTAAQGSFSVRAGEDAFLITPWEVDRARVTAADLVLVDGGRRETGKEPSRTTELHRAIYRRHPAVRAVVLATPPSATAFSVTARELDSRTIPESYIFLRTVRCLPHDSVYVAVEDVVEAVSAASPVAIIENNGALVVGSSVLDAFDRLEVLESTADALIQSRLLGPVNPMGAEAIRELEAAFF